LFRIISWKIINKSSKFAKLIDN